MKTKIRLSRNKKIIALIVIAIVLLASAVTGVTLYLKGNNEAQALTQEEQNRIVENTANVEGGNSPSENEPTNETTPGEELPQNEITNSTIAEPTEPSNEGTTTTNPGTTNTTNPSGGDLTTTEESVTQRERLVSEDFLVGWTPIHISTLANTADNYINSPKLEIIKNSYSQNVNNKTNAVQKGETIIYEIKVKNTGNIPASHIKISDTISNKVTVVAIEDNGVLENGKITWDITINPQEEIVRKFTVKVNEDAEGIIDNQAIVNGDKTNVTENAIIKTTKSSEVLRNAQVITETAKPNDQIRYTITLQNTSNMDTTTKIEDMIPEGTMLVENSITDDGKVIGNKIIWESIAIKANETKKVEFIVTIKEDAVKDIKNVAFVNGTNTNETTDPIANIIGSKKVDKKEAKVGEKLLYTITLTNQGTAAGKVTVEDKIPEGTTYVQDSVSHRGIYNEETNKIIWTDVEVGLENPVTLTFEVTINQETKNTVVNTAILDDKEIEEKPETKVANITGIKSSSITVESLKEKDEIEYTITLTNQGTTAGKVTVEDMIPEGTSYIVNSANHNGVYNQEANKVIWTDVEVGLENPVTLTFKVSVNAFEAGITEKYIRNHATIIEGEDTNEVVDKVEKKYIEIEVEKVWEDNNNVAKKRPGAVVLQVLNGDTIIKTQTVTEQDGWKYTFTDLPKYDEQGNEIVYTIDEADLDNIFYQKTVDNVNHVITNTFDVPDTKIDLTVTKSWVDNDNIAQKRPGSIFLQVFNGSTLVQEVEVTGEQNWQYTFTDLKKYDDLGDEIVYTVNEREAKQGDLFFYEKSIDEENNTVINTFSVPDEKVSVTVEKVWDDNNDQAQKRPDSIIVNLLANGTVNQTVELTNSKLSHTFSNLAKYDSLGEEINYTVSESETNQGDLYFYADGVITGDMENGYTITNTFDVPDEKVEVTVEKVWDDNNDQAQKRPDSITVNLLANDTVNQTVKLTDNKLSHTFSNLPKYDSLGNEINYTVSEEETNPGDLYFYADGVITGSAKDGYTITNTFDVPDEQTSVTVEKVWDDNNDQAQKRPDSITVTLLANGTANQTVELTDSKLTYTFINLAKYNDLGEEINYRVSESETNQGDLYFYADGVITGNMENGYTITNTFSVPDEKVEVTVEKVWDDNNDLAKKRPNSITVNLLANGTVNQTVELTNSKLSHTFNNLAKYNDLGNEINYTVSEEETNLGDLFFYADGVITGSAKDGYTITNTFSVSDEKVEVTVEKVWDDNNDLAKKRPDSITVTLLANGKVTTTTVQLTDSKLSHTFSNLAKYDSLGNEINYTVSESETNQGDLYFYADGVITGSAKDGYTITNTFAVPDEKVEVAVEKIWDDNNDLAKKRPNSITVNLLANGIVNQTVELTNSKLSHTFSNLAKYDELGKEINYTVTESETNQGDLYFYLDGVIRGSIEDGYTITNTFSVPDEKVEVTVEKVWNDNNDQAQKRPDSITVTLLANGEQERTVELTDSKLSHIFSNLAKYDSLGNEINYTVAESETNQGDLYFYADGVITGSAKDGYTITNTFSVPDEKVEVAVEKIWDDNNDLAKKRPNSITVNLLANGIVNQTVELTNSKLSHTFSNLAKYDSLGNEINYTVSEEETNPGDLYFYADGVITGAAKDGYTITNTFDVPDEKVEVTVVKAWADNNNEAQKRPDSIILQVKIGDTIVKEQVVSGDKVTDEGWSYTFTDLAKYDSLGNEITYTVDEAKVSSIFYTKSVNNETRTITNTFSVPDEKVEITVEKVWNDNNNQAQKRPDSIVLQLKNGSTVVKEQVVTGNATTNEGWSYTFTDLAKYDSLGNLITYTVDEAEKVQGDLYFYEKTINGKTVINTFKVPADKVTIPVTKVWVDDNNALGYRPTSIVLQIKNSAGVVKEQVVTGNATTNEGWSYEFSVAKYDSIGNEITYTVDERPVNPGELDFYEKQISGRTITNTVIHLTTQKEVNKQQANPNETLTYTITVKNDSQKDLSGVVITDVVDTEHLNIVSTNGGEVQSDGKTIKWTKNISAGQTITITFTAKVKANVVPGTEIRNTAKVNGKDTNEVVTKVVKDIIIHKKEYPIKAVDIVLVMDVSGSMKDNSRLTNAKSAAEKLINEIFPDGAVNTGSTVTVLKFSTGASYVGKATSAQNKQQLINLIKSDNFKADGGTNIYEALSLTSSTLSNLTNTRKEVIFLTDGAPTPTFYIDLDNRVKNNDAGYSNNTDAKIAAKAAEVKAKATDVYSIGFAVNSLDDVRNRNSYAYCNYTRCTTSGCTQPHVSANGNKYHYETPRAYAKRTLGVIASDSSKVYYPTDSADSIINDFMEILRDITLTTTTIQAESTTVVIPVTQGYTLNETQKVVITINGVEHKVDFSDIGQYGLSYNSAKKEFTWNIANYLEDELELEFVIK